MTPKTLKQLGEWMQAKDLTIQITFREIVPGTKWWQVHGWYNHDNVSKMAGAAPKWGDALKKAVVFFNETYTKPEGM